MKTKSNPNQTELFPGLPAASARGRVSKPAAVRPVAVAERVSSPAPLPALVTPWVRLPQPDGSIMLKPGKPMVQEDEIGTREAARILGLAQRTVESYCDSGLLVEGQDWWQRPPSPGSSRGGNIRIKRAAVLRLRGEA